MLGCEMAAMPTDLQESAPAVAASATPTPSCPSACNAATPTPNQGDGREVINPPGVGLANHFVKYTGPNSYAPSSVREDSGRIGIGLGETPANNLFQVAGLINFHPTLWNTYLGTSAGAANTTGYGNTGTGYTALQYNSTGYYNTASGFDALIANSSGNNNTANGSSALSTNSSGNNNTANGSAALMNTISSDNTASGSGALAGISTGSNNTALGSNAGYDCVVLTTVSNSTFLGYKATSCVDGITNSTAIGNGAQVTASNQVVIGNEKVTETLLHGKTSVNGVAVCLVDGTGCPGTAPSAQPVWVSGAIVDGTDIACPPGTRGSTWRFGSSGGVMTMSIFCN